MLELIKNLYDLSFDLPLNNLMDDKFSEQNEILLKMEEQFKESLSKEQQIRYEETIHQMHKVAEVEEIECFESGLRLGVNLMLELLQ